MGPEEPLLQKTAAVELLGTANRECRCSTGTPQKHLERACEQLHTRKKQQRKQPISPTAPAIGGDGCAASCRIGIVPHGRGDAGDVRELQSKRVGIPRKGDRFRHLERHHDRTSPRSLSYTCNNQLTSPTVYLSHHAKSSGR